MSELTFETEMVEFLEKATDELKKRGRGRPPKEDKKEIPYDPEQVAKFIERLFTIESEMATLRDDKKELKEEFKDKINSALIGKIIKLVKVTIDIQEKENASPETVEEISNQIKEKINMIL